MKELLGETALQVLCLAAYIVGVAGMAATLGGWVGWAVVAAAGAVPGAVLLRKELERRELEKAIAAHAPEQYTPPPSGAPAPGPLLPPAA